MNWGDKAKIIMKEIIFCLASIIYMCLLHRLNKKLLEIVGDESIWVKAFDVLKHNDGEALWYFLVAMILFILGIMLLSDRFTKVTQGSYEQEDTLLIVVTMIITVIILVCIFVAINNPILQSVLIAVAAVYGVSKAN